MTKRPDDQISRRVRSAAVRLGRDTLRSRPAHAILQQLERHHIANRKPIERHAVSQIAAMEKNVGAVFQPDETVALSDEERRHASDGGRAWALGRPSLGKARRRRFSGGVSLLFWHAATSGALNGGASDRRSRRHRRRRVPVAGALR